MWPFKRKHETETDRVFTGNCMVFQYTGDKRYAGRCWHSTYNGVCHLHGDVSAYLDNDIGWPADFDLKR